MSGTDGSWQEQAHRIVAGLEGGRARIDRDAMRDLVNTYPVRSLDTTALRFSIPVALAAPPGASGPGVDGAAGVLIEAVKAAGGLRGRGLERRGEEHLPPRGHRGRGRPRRRGRAGVPRQRRRGRPRGGGGAGPRRSGRQPLL